MTDWNLDEVGEHWVSDDKGYELKGVNKYSEDFFDNFIKENKISECLEVGSGTGRLISKLKVKKNACDINKFLIKYIGVNYPYIKTKVCPVDDLDYKDKSFEMVYTYQVLQHVPPDKIDKAVSELIRVSKDKILLVEGFVDYAKQGEMVHSSGSFSYDFTKFGFKIINEDDENNGKSIRYYLMERKRY